MQGRQRGHGGHGHSSGDAATAGGDERDGSRGEGRRAAHRRRTPWICSGSSRRLTRLRRSLQAARPARSDSSGGWLARRGGGGCGLNDGTATGRRHGIHGDPVTAAVVQTEAAAGRWYGGCWVRDIWGVDWRQWWSNGEGEAVTYRERFSDYFSLFISFIFCILKLYIWRFCTA